MEIAHSFYKLNVGCGKIKFQGWINIDVETSVATDLVWDVTRGLPFPNTSCSLIYHEHFLEHLTVQQGVFFLRECHRVLVSGGVMRIAMPPLDFVVQKYLQEDWRNGQDWLTWPEYQFIQTKAEMLNIAFRWWGHQWLYDQEELYRRLNESGFNIIHSVKWGESEIVELRNRETRKESLLLCEIIK